MSRQTGTRRERTTFLKDVRSQQLVKRFLYLHNSFYLLGKSQSTVVICICNYINQLCNTNLATATVLIAKESSSINNRMLQQQPTTRGGNFKKQFNARCRSNNQQPEVVASSNSQTSYQQLTIETWRQSTIGKKQRRDRKKTYHRGT